MTKVKFLTSGIPHGYAYSQGEEGAIEPKKALELSALGVVQILAKGEETETKTDKAAVAAEKR